MTTSAKLWVRLPLGALSGLLAGFAARAVADLVSAAVRPQAGPLTAVGGATIDRTPTPVKDWAIRHFGEDDKLVLQLGILATLAALAIVLGVVALRFRRAYAAGVLIFGVIGAAAALTRPDSSGATKTFPGRGSAWKYRSRKNPRNERHQMRPIPLRSSAVNAAGSASWTEVPGASDCTSTRLAGSCRIWGTVRCL